MRLAMISVLVVLLGVAVGVEAMAQARGARPWEDGVSAEQRTRALGLFRQGNSLFARSEYKQAGHHYRQALRVWDHPRIHGNLTMALIHLDELVAAWTHLEKALAFGPLPFAKHVHTQLITHRKLLAGRLSTLTVECPVAGASVTVDGQPLFVGPGKQKLLVRSGRHEVVAKRSGYLTRSERVLTMGGTAAHVVLTPVHLRDAKVRERKWAAWKPWTLFGAGLAVAALGVPLGMASNDARSRFEAALLRECATGCKPEQIALDVKDHKDRARFLNRVEVGAYVVGGAAVLAGSVLAYINREREYVLSESGVRIAIEPAVSPVHVGFAVKVGF